MLVPTSIGEDADPFATPFEILPEWFLLPTFEILRLVPNKILGIISMVAVPLGLLCIPFIENINPFCNPWRRNYASGIFLFGLLFTLVLGYKSL